MSEEWRPMPGFEGYYCVSSCGRVWSIRNSKMLRPKKNHGGYLRVSPSVDGYRKECLVHRLVALAFIPNPDNKPTVNHLNEDKEDNRVENLEWATIAEQNIYGTRIKRAVANTDWKGRAIDYAVVASKHDYYNMNKKQMKPVLQFDKHGIFIARHPGVMAAARNVGVSASKICLCLKGERRSCGGFIWKYEQAADSLLSL